MEKKSCICTDVQNQSHKILIHKLLQSYKIRTNYARIAHELYFSQKMPKSTQTEDFVRFRTIFVHI